MPRFVSGLDRTVVPDPGAVIGVRIGVEHLAPCAGVRQSQPIAGMFGGRGEAALPSSKTPSAFKSDVHRWTWSGLGGEDQLEQKALISGKVQWTISDPPKCATLMAVGSKEKEETY